jgi:hypothetical protein
MHWTDVMSGGARANLLPAQITDPYRASLRSRTPPRASNPSRRNGAVSCC